MARCNRLASCGQAIWLPKLGSINGSIWIHLDDGDLDPHSPTIGKPSSLNGGLVYLDPHSSYDDVGIFMYIWYAFGFGLHRDGQQVM